MFIVGAAALTLVTSSRNAILYFVFGFHFRLLFFLYFRNFVFCVFSVVVEALFYLFI